MKAIQKRSLQTQKNILEAAEQLLRDNPYTEITMPAVAKAAKVSIGGLYGRFISREALLEEVYSRYRQRRDHMIHQLLDSSDELNVDLFQRLMRVSELFVSLHMKDTGILRSFIIHHWLTDLSKPPQDIKQEISFHLDRLTEYVIGSEVRLKKQKQRVFNVISYMVSISKDQIVITPDSHEEFNSVNAQSLITDITKMTVALLN